MFATSNEIYGELYYYSVVKLLRYLKITERDHFLDIGSGLGRLVFQIFLTTNAASVTGVEINEQRYDISCKIKDNMKQHKLILDEYISNDNTNINEFELSNLKIMFPIGFGIITENKLIRVSKDDFIPSYENLNFTSIVKDGEIVKLNFVKKMITR